MGYQTFLDKIIYKIKCFWCRLVYRYFIWISGYGSGPEFEASIIFIDTGKWPKWYKPTDDIPHHDAPTGREFSDYEKDLWHKFFEKNK